MKKLLACLLALLLTLGLALPAFAEEPEAEEPPPLPAVTHITAAWDGTVLLTGTYLSPRFGPENVTVTVHYDDGTTETARDSIRYDRNAETGVVTVTYMKEFEARFDFPLDFLEVFIEAQKPLKALTTGKTTPGAGTYAVLAFTPRTSGYYDFESKAALLVTDQSFAEIKNLAMSWNKTKSLRAGQTYYVFAELYEWSQAQDLSQAEITVKRISFPRQSLRLVTVLLEGIVNGFFWLLIMMAFMIPGLLAAPFIWLGRLFG